MIVAPLPTLIHHVFRRPLHSGWLAYSDGADVRLFGAAPWRLVALEAAQQLTEAVTLAHLGVTRAEMDTFDCEHCDADRVLSEAPYAHAYHFSMTVETMFANRLGLTSIAHARAIEGLREPSISRFAIRQAP